MGMDLVPANEHVDGFHANWTMWGNIGDLLTELECDLSQMSGSNDGEVVDGPTAKAWGDAILANIDRIQVVMYPDRLFEGGERPEFHVEGTESPVNLSAHQAAQELARQLLQQAGVEMPETGSGDEDAPPRVIALSDMPEALQLVRDFAEFCLKSGGFEQW
jgi:hypothetical protein